MTELSEVSESTSPDEPREVSRLSRRIAQILSVSWAAALIGLTALGIHGTIDRARQALEHELSLRATVVYGLAFFDDAGRLSTELLDREPIVDDAEIEIRIWSGRPDEPVVWGPARPDPVDPELLDLHARVLSLQLESFTGRVGEHFVALVPVFPDEGDSPRAVAWVRQPASALWDRVRGPVVQSCVVGSILVGLGILLSLRVAHLATRPLVRARRGRERLLAGAAHELRTPLTTISAIAQRDEGDPRDALTKIVDTVGAAQHRVDALLLHARLDLGAARPPRQRTRIDLLVDVLLEPYPHARVELVEVEATIEVEAFRVATANILDNARRHGGAREGRGLHIHLEPGRLTVDDSGPEGGPGAVREPASVGPRGVGTGLIAEVAALHGGTFEIGPRPTGSGGSRAVFTWR